MRRTHLVLVLLAGLAGPLTAQRPDTTRAAGPVRPLSLDEAVRLAEDRSEAVLIARAGVDRAAGQQKQARSGFFPQLSGSATYTRTLESQFSALQGDGDSDTAGGPPAPESCSRFFRNPTNPVGERLDSLEIAVECISAVDPFARFSSLPFGRENQYDLRLSLSQNLFTSGQLLGQSRAANAGRRIAELELDAQRAQMVLDVTEAYYDAALSDRLLAIAESALEQAERTFEETRLAQDVGTQPEFEVLRAQVNRDTQRPVVIQRRAQRDIAYLRLKQLLELPPDEPLALTTGLGDTLELAPPPIEGVEAVRVAAVEVDSAAAERRAPVRQAVEAVSRSEAQLAVARSQGLPKLQATSEFARLGYPDDVIPSWDDFVTDWTVGVSLRIPLFTGGRVSGEKQVARANLEQARLELRQARELAVLDARSTRAQLEAAEAAWEASRGTVQQALRAYQIAEIRFREGISTQTELNESRLLLQQAQANRAQAARDLQVARVRVALLENLPLGAGGGATAPASTQASVTAGAR